VSSLTNRSFWNGPIPEKNENIERIVDRGSNNSTGIKDVCATFENVGVVEYNNNNNN
jgi:hypothetical protein